MGRNGKKRKGHETQGEMEAWRKTSKGKGQGTKGEIIKEAKM